MHRFIILLNLSASFFLLELVTFSHASSLSHQAHYFPATIQCSQIPSAGTCRALTVKAFYNQNTKRCEEFTWGGCGGVVPFHSIQECERAKCGKSDDHCHLAPVIKICGSSKTRWYYDGRTNACKSFTWGGCSGSAQFRTRIACEESCYKNRE